MEGVEVGEDVEDYGVGGEVGYYWWHGERLKGRVCVLCL